MKFHLSSVSVANWSPFVNSCSLGRPYIIFVFLIFIILVFSRFDFEGLITSVPELCILFTFDEMCAFSKCVDLQQRVCVVS